MFIFYALPTDHAVLFEKTAQDFAFSVISYRCLATKMFLKGVQIK